MQYVKYSKIENSIENWNEDYMNIEKWVILEKVHGANFSFIYDEITKKIVCAKRTDIIHPDEYFFGYEVILDDSLPKINNIIDQIREQNILFDKVIVYGELFGGVYPNIKTKYKSVQKGVFYSPNIHFYAFDILIIYNKKKYFLDYENALDIFRKSNIFHAEPLAIYDNLSEALKYPIEFNSKIPEKLGLPLLSNNKAEGIIIKGMKELSELNRCIIKIKIPKFSETKDNKNLSEMVDLYKMANSCITNNRYNNTVSKVGTENITLIHNLFVEDILEELKIKDKDTENTIKGWLYKKIKNKFK